MSDIQAIRERQKRREKSGLKPGGMLAREGHQAHIDCGELLSALTAYQARAEAAEARVGYLQTIIDCVVANCEASASSHQERIETIHRVTSALALEWTDDRELKGPGQ